MCSSDLVRQVALHAHLGEMRAKPRRILLRAEPEPGRELESQRAADRHTLAVQQPVRIAGRLQDNGYTSEELKLMLETRRVLGQPELAVAQLQLIQVQLHHRLDRLDRLAHQLPHPYCH